MEVRQENLSGSNENISGYIGNLSELLGTNEAALRLLITVFLGYPLAIIHRNFFYGKPENVQHLFCALTGFALGYWNYGIDIFHTVFAIFASYVTILLIGGTALSVGIIFIFNLTYLLFGYCYVGTDSYDINWTMPQCILVLRLIGIAYDCYDGKQPPESLSSENKKWMLTKPPTILEIYGHTLFPAGFMVGPQFPMKRYQNFIAGNYGKDAQTAPDSVHYALVRLGLGVLYLAIFQALGMIVSDEYMMSVEFGELGFVSRMLLMGAWGRFTLYKYISCWLLTEGACILFGLAHNGEENGKVLWNGVENVKLSTFENTTEFTHYIQSFNINTNQWVAQYVYKRLKFLGNRHISQLAALGFLAVWHGLHSGYYVCFFFEFIVVYMERDVKSIVKSNETLSAFFGNPAVSVGWNLILRLYTFIFMGWCLLPFALLKFERYWLAFATVSHVGTILFVPWVFLYGPIMRMVFKRTKPKENAE